MTKDITLIQGDARHLPLADESVQMCVTSPPYYGLRDYNVDGQIGLEETPEAYVATMVGVFREVRRVLKGNGVLFINLGDTYAASGRGGNPDESSFRKQATNVGSLVKGSKAPPGYKPKDLIGIPWMVAFALRADGWWLRSDIIWQKLNPMTESVKDRPTKAHEYIFLLAKSERYYYNADAIAEDAITDVKSLNWRDREYDQSFLAKQQANGVKGRPTGVAGYISEGKRNKRSVWTVNPKPFTGWTRTVRWVRVSKDDVCDGMKRITSQGCPVHDRPGFQGGECGCPAESHSHNNVPDPSSIRSRERSGNSTHPDARIPASNSGSVVQLCVETAKPHSTQTHKTALGPLTDPACIASAQMCGGTGDIPKSPETSGSVERISENNTLPDDLDDCQMEQMGGHIVDSSSRVPSECICGFYRKTTAEQSHFATFPPDLVKPCILAGSRPGDLVLDPFNGSGTTGEVAREYGRRYVGIELNPEYIELSKRRLEQNLLF